MWDDKLFEEVFKEFATNHQQRVAEWRDNYYCVIDPAKPNSEETVIMMRGKNGAMRIFDDEGEVRPKFKTKQAQCDWLEQKLQTHITAIVEQNDKACKLREEIAVLNGEIRDQQSTIEQLKATCYELTCQTQEQAGFIRAHKEAEKKEADSQPITMTRGEVLNRGYTMPDKLYISKDNMLDRPNTTGPKPWYKL